MSDYSNKIQVLFINDYCFLTEFQSYLIKKLIVFLLIVEILLIGIMNAQYRKM